MGEPGVNKGFLLFLSCVLLVFVSGCGSSSTVILPNGFLYAGNSSRPGSMAAFSVTTGALGLITGSPFLTTGNAPYTLAAWPPPLPAAAVTTKFLYAGIPATQNGGVITRVLHRQLLGSVTGGILLMPIKSDHTLDVPQLFASGGDYDPIAITPNPGNFLYAIDLTANLLVPFSIDTGKGALTAILQGSMPVGPDPFNVVVDPQGKFVFVANCDCFTNPSNKGSVQVFSINANGTLNTVGTFVLGGAVTAQPIALAISPDSKFLFVASLDNNVYVESIANGSFVDQGSAPLPADSTPVSIAVSTDGNYVYTGNAGTQNVSFFLNCLQATPPTGCPVGSPPPPLAFPSNNSSTPVGGTVGVILTDPTNPPQCTSTTSTNCLPTSVSGFLYVTDYDHGTIQAFSITSTSACTGVANCIPGTLTQSGTAVNTGGSNPFGLAIAH